MNPATMTIAELRAACEAPLTAARANPMKALPKGYTIVAGPNPDFRFVRTPKGQLIPNQGTGFRESMPGDAGIIADATAFFIRNSI